VRNDERRDWAHAAHDAARAAAAEGIEAAHSAFLAAARLPTECVENTGAHNEELRKADRAKRRLDFALGADVQVGAGRVRTDRGHDGKVRNAVRAGSTCEIHHHVEVNRTETLVRAGLLDGRAQAAEDS
jgi:hypothetical protein